ncbi:MAG: hypothetical protein KDA84_02815 [Planctomycetaceae bacterium]|nr:hypothetical protein [Planctomycetaceae bacterium]
MATRLLFLTTIVVWMTTAKAEEPQTKRVTVNAGTRAIIGKGPIKPLPPGQADQLKRLAKAQGDVAKAIKELSEAQRKLVQASSPDEKKKAQLELTAAKLVLDKAQKAVEAELKTAQTPQVLRVNASAGGARIATPTAGGVKPVKDFDDPMERFLVLTPGGPLVVEVELTVEGKPFRHLRKSIIDRMMSYADSDKDGKPTWEEAFASSRFSLGRLRINSDSQKATYLKLYDTNHNGLVERDEARRALTHFTRADAFTVGYGQVAYGRPIVLSDGRVSTGGLSGNVDLVPVLDVDRDGIVSESEIAAAGERLKSRDADDNDLLYPQEVLTNSATNQQGTRYVPTTQTSRNLTISLGPSITDEQVFRMLQTVYKNSDGDITIERFSLAKDLFQKLDANKNGKLESEEVSKLGDVEPQIAFSVDLGSKGKGIQIQQASLKTETKTQTDDVVSIEFPGLILKTHVKLGSGEYPYNNNLGNLGDSYLNRYDKDNNGYLDKDELTGPYARYLEMWDQNSDGKVFPKEIVESFQQMREPQAKQVRAMVSRHGNSLFQALDQSGDGRLSLREMRTASVQLKPFDKNKDGKITATEIPETININFVLGFGYLQTGRPVQSTPLATPPKSDAPDWFTRMDRNGDGDVTLKEFLGDKKQFQSLDANQDGFIEPKEANAAGK